jgi:hypothetical protein
MAVPDSWRYQIQQPPDGSPPTLKFNAKSGSAFELLITPLWSLTDKTSPPDSASIRKQVESAARAIRPDAVEKVLAIRPVKGSTGVGYYFSATYRAASPGEYRHLTQGMLPVGELTVPFTILSNDGADATVSAVLLLLQDATQNKAEPT